MIEFLIRRTDGEWFDNAWSACNPKSVPYELIPGWGSHRIRVLGGVEVSVSDEEPGYQICFDGDIDEATARKIVDEMLENLVAATGQKGRVVEI
jgi:hypothetical protein